jgi:hypothetical protein
MRIFALLRRRSAEIGAPVISAFDSRRQSCYRQAPRYAQGCFGRLAPRAVVTMQSSLADLVEPWHDFDLLIGRVFPPGCGEKRAALQCRSAKRLESAAA